MPTGRESNGRKTQSATYYSAPYNRRDWQGALPPCVIFGDWQFVDRIDEIDWRCQPELFIAFLAEQAGLAANGTEW